MRLAVLVDRVTIAAGVAIILMTSDDGADDTAGHCADCCACTRAYPWKDGAGESARTCTECGAGGGAGDCMVVLRRCRAAAKGETTHRGGRD